MFDFNKVLSVVKAVAADRRVIAAASALAAKSVYAKLVLGALLGALGVQ